ncbi:MAG: hypothetical protein AB1656_03490 [Candidatus Omnitrophota bacterium]
MKLTIQIKTNIIFACLSMVVMSAAGQENPYFKIRVVDEETGRGVPMAELKTVNEIRYYTDSNGIAAFYEPGLMGIDVFFSVTSHGYSYPKDGFGMQGVRLRPKSGKEAVIRLQRHNLAERLYRITGQGVYRDSLLTGEAAPIENPALNGQVAGQDSAVVAPYRGKLYWFWGDTSRPQYPLGNFRVSGATSEFPDQVGLPPDQGVNLHYFTDSQGFCKSMSPIVKEGLIWIDGLLTLPGESGQERLIAHYAHMRSLGEMLEHGLVIFDDARQEFEKLVEFELDKKWQCPRGHPLRVKDGEKEYIYFPMPFPTVRVQADLSAIKDQSKYEAFTCLQNGSDYKGENSLLVLEKGHPLFAWKTGADPIGPAEEKELIEAKKIAKEDARFLPKDADSGHTVVIHAGSVHWNVYRKKWILIGVEVGGTSYLGEVWCAESGELTGPWKKAKKIVTHERYSFYNPVHHPFFDRRNGRMIYFEGTYSTTFSGNPCATPRYDYNQIMYRLDLERIPMNDE